MIANSNNTVLILGAGLGGLLCGALLSLEGLQVTVLEKNKQIGGGLQSFGVDGKRFETAVHYIGSLGKGQTLYKIFDYVGLLEHLQLQQLDLDCFDEIHLGTEIFELAQGYDRFIQVLTQRFPDEEAGILNYIAEIKNVCEHFPLYNMRLGSLEEKQKVVGAGLKEILDKHFTHETIKQVLCGNNQLYAGDYETTPFYLHALIVNSYIQGSFKCKEGSIQIARQLQKIIESHQGKVIRNQHVIEIQEQGGNVTNVLTKEGANYQASIVISNIHPGQTYELLNSSLIRPVTKKRLRQTKHTASAFMVNIALAPFKMNYRNRNIYFHKTPDVWRDLNGCVFETPNSYGIFFIQDKLHPEFASGVSILTYLEDQGLPALNTFRTTSERASRGEAYETWKSNYANAIIEQVLSVLPELKEAQCAVESCTPLTYRDYLNIPHGSMYGFQKNITDLANTTFSTRTKLKNLFLTGQNINLHGILGVSITSILTVGDIVGLEYIVNKINSHSQT